MSIASALTLRLHDSGRGFRSLPRKYCNHKIAVKKNSIQYWELKSLSMLKKKKKKKLWIEPHIKVQHVPLWANCNWAGKEVMRVLVFWVTERDFWSSHNNRGGIRGLAWSSTNSWSTTTEMRNSFEWEELTLIIRHKSQQWGALCWAQNQRVSRTTVISLLLMQSLSGYDDWNSTNGGVHIHAEEF